jgi:GNAT superfamily N-acetyltransferase
MKIRAIRESELNSVLALYTHLHSTDEPVPSDEIAIHVWQELMANTRRCYLGGYEGNELVSSCTVIVIPNLTRGCRPYAVIENVVTHANHRNKGWGKAILKSALDFAWEQHCYKAMLSTGRKDEAVFKFYEAAGFNRNAKQAFTAKPDA